MEDSEIEDDFRQMEDFKGTKYNYITYHIIMTLTGYLYFQIYNSFEAGKAYVRKLLLVVVKNYKETHTKMVVYICWAVFGNFTIS